MSIDKKIVYSKKEKIDHSLKIRKFGAMISDLVVTGGLATGFILTSEKIYNYVKSVNDIRSRNCLNAIYQKLIEEQKLTKEEVEHLIEKDSTNFIVDALTQAMLNQSEKLQIVLGIIYAEYLKNSEDRTTQGQYLRMFNAVKQITETDFEVFYQICKENFSELENNNILYVCYLSKGGARSSVVKRIIDNSFCSDFYSLKISRHLIL